MDKLDEEDHAMLYCLCAVAAGAAILNAVFLLWQTLKLRKPKGFGFVKHSLLLLDAFFSVTALALVLLVLYRDVGGNALCDAGGYLIIAGSQLSLWFQATACISLLLWMRKSLSLDLQRRNGPIFALIACAQALVIAIISALPYMNLPYFDSHQDFYYTCTPLRLPGEEGWAYSSLLLILDWIAVVIGAGALIKISIHCSSCRQPSISAAEKLEELHAEGSKLRQQRQSFLTLAVCLVGWVAVLIIANITYFSKGNLDQDAGQWILGFSLSITLCLRPIFNISYQLISKRMAKNGLGLKSYSGFLFQSRPSGLQRLARLPDSHQTAAAQKYLVQWRDEKSGQLLSGTMKTFAPTEQNLWRNEVNALEKLRHEGHPNLAPYLWVSPNNPFTQSICSNTGDPVSRYAGVICRMHFPNGTLSDFLRTRIQHLSEISLHKVSLDVANGLEFLHQRSLVHNGLNSNAVFMTSVSEKNGMKAVIGDLENCYEVSRDEENPGHLYKNRRTWTECDTTELFTITSRMALQQDSSHNKFAPDIRAFGLLVLEMLVAMSQYKQKIKSVSRSRVSRLLEEVVRDATENEQPVDTSTPHEYHLHDDENCDCSTRVVDVRVHNGHAMYQPSDEIEEWQSTYDGPQAQGNEPSNQGELDETSLIPTQPLGAGEHVLLNAAQNNGADMCLTCGQTFNSTSSNEMHSCLASQGTDRSEEESLCASCQYEEVNEPLDYNSPVVDEGSATPPKLSVRAFSVDKTKKPVKPRSQGQAPFTRDHVVELPEIGESDTESVASVYRPYARRGSHSGKQILTNGSFLTPRTTPELRTPTSRSDSATATPTSVNQDARSPVLGDNTDSSDSKSHVKETESRQDTPLVIKVQEIGFQTIYEEDENQNSTLPPKNKPQIPPKPRKLFKPPVPLKRRPPPPLPRSEGTTSGQTEGASKKRFSVASLDESVVSAADSGLGSSHYESSYCGSEISSIYLQPGSRNTIYSGSMTEGSETYCPVRQVLHDKKSGSTNRITDSGIESSADSCEELTARHSRMQQGHFPQDSDPTTYTSEGSSNANTEHHVTNEDEDSVNNTYEQLPDIPDSPAVQPRRKGKQPCVGHHEHLENSPCKLKQPSLDAAGKTSATISTQTTDSLERPKSDRRKSGENVVEGDWKMLGDKASNSDESDYQQHFDCDDSQKRTSFPPTSFRGPSVQPHTVRQKTLVHQETVHSQPVVSQTATYPQKLQPPPHLPPKQIYTQSLPHYQYYEISPNVDNHNGNKYTVSSIENLYTQQQGSTYTRYALSDKAEIHRPRTFVDQDKNSKADLNHRCQIDSHDPCESCHQVDVSRQPSVPSNVPSGYPPPWSDYRHNMAYYKSEQPNVHEGYRSAFHKPSPNQKYTSFIQPYSDGHRETDEEKLSHVIDKLNKEGRLGVVGGQLMPLLRECYSQEPAPPANHIIQRLEQVMPTAIV